MLRRLGNALGAVVLLLATTGVIHAQTQVKPGFNVFTIEQEIQLGEESAKEIGSQLPRVNDSVAQRYISDLGNRLAKSAPGAEYPYSFTLVNVSDINAFALPGGPIFVNRGLVEAANSEAELSGVLSHEISHIALRHGTNQVSKASLAQAGIGILGGIFGGGRSLSDLINVAGGLGFQAVFMKFSRTAERQADIVGSQILWGAGYDPLAMADFFRLLEEQRERNPGKLERFFSSHPDPGGRALRVQEEAELLGNFRRTSPIGNFVDVQRRLRRMPPAVSMAELAPDTGRSGSGEPERDRGSSDRDASIDDIPRPSTQFRTFRSRDRRLSIPYPANWNASEHNNEFGVTVTPEGGARQRSDGGNDIIYGLILDEFEGDDDQQDFFGAGPSLENLSNQLVEGILKGNQHLEWAGGVERFRLDGAAALSGFLTGRSPTSGSEERVRVVTRSYGPNRLLYLLTIAPDSGYPSVRPTFDRMLQGLRVD